MIKNKGFSAFTIKLFACLCMTIDHAGLMFFPQYEWMRIVGRLAFPLFAYFIAEGCRYTKDKTKRFFSVFVLGVICEIVYVVFSKEYIGNILLTFSISILLISLLEYTKKAFDISDKRGFVFSSVFVLCVMLVFVFCEYIGVEYGFFGVITPVLVTLFDDVSENAKNTYNNPYKRLLSLAGFSAGLILLSFVNPVLWCQKWCLLSVVLLLFYNGQKGKYSFKYAFYLFYPLHVVVLQGLYILLTNYFVFL